jgi:hypothetical protein
VIVKHFYVGSEFVAILHDLGAVPATPPGGTLRADFAHLGRDRSRFVFWGGQWAIANFTVL